MRVMYFQLLNNPNVGTTSSNFNFRWCQMSNNTDASPDPAEPGYNACDPGSQDVWHQFGDTRHPNLNLASMTDTKYQFV